MAKPLREPPPSSSIARLFDLDAAARAVATPLGGAELLRHNRSTVQPEAAPRPTPAGLAPNGERPHIKRELVFTPSSDETFTRLVDLYRRVTGTRLTTSHVARALMKGVAHCMDYLEKEARHIGPLKLPCNALGRELERERFEARIADAFVAGIRAAPAMDKD